MLFHVTMTHTEDNCPGYRPELKPAVRAAAEKQADMAKDLGVKILFMVNGAPEHVYFALVDADKVSSVGQFFINAFSIRSSFKVNAVQPMSETDSWIGTETARQLG